MHTLYLVATPLGNLEDITLRALRVLREVSLIATEDTRTTGKLLAHFEIANNLISYHEHSPPAQIQRILEALTTGDVALVSEAGTPLLSDPGYKLVQAALAEQVTVVAVPGASAILTALPVSGLPTHEFLYGGFVPRKAHARRRLFERLKTQTATVVLFESPHRLLETLTTMRDSFGGARQIALCRELTKLYEEIWRGSLAEACSVWAVREIRGEFTLVIAGATAAQTWDEAAVRAALQSALDEGLSTRDAVQQVTALSGRAKREVYALAQALT